MPGLRFLNDPDHRPAGRYRRLLVFEIQRVASDAQRSLEAGATDLAKLVERVSLSAPEAEPLGLELANFVRAVRGEEPPAVTGRDGLSALALAFRVLEAVGSPATLQGA